MTISNIDPIQDPRWSALLEKHSDASIFHTVGWLKALQRTYGFHAAVYTSTAASADLEDGIVCCRVHSWLTGNRTVSLPFSDHCQPLVKNDGTFVELLSFLYRERMPGEFIEIRPVRMQSSIVQATASIQEAKTYCLHRLDISDSRHDIFARFHKDCIQRKIHRAERENLVYHSGRSISLLKDFYGLQVRTRRKHGLPPQPFRWFSNLLDCLGDQLTIHTATKDELPVAAMITIRFKKTVTYKYGCSNPKLNNMGGVPFLFWNAIQNAKAGGATEFDLGRSDLHNQGLIDFKDRLGSVRSAISYYKAGDIQSKSQRPSTVGGRATFILQRQVMPHLPGRFLMLAGRLFYKHVG